jgi:hypothetical protein
VAVMMMMMMIDDDDDDKKGVWAKSLIYVTTR